MKKMNKVVLTFISLIISDLLHAGIHGIDNRIEVTDKKFPWSAIGRLMVGDSQCTATLIGPCQILTAAHCVISDSNKEPYKYPMKFTSHNGVDSSGIKNIIHNKKEEKTSSWKYDWAIAILDKPIGRKAGWFTVNYQDEQIIPIDSLTIAGYSIDKFSGGKLSADDSVIAHKIDKDNIISLEADTFLGASGASIWRMEYGRPRIYGIHVGTKQIEDSATHRKKQVTFEKYSESNRTIGIASALFFRQYRESLLTRCE